MLPAQHPGPARLLNRSSTGSSTASAAVSTSAGWGKVWSSSRVAGLDGSWGLVSEPEPGQGHHNFRRRRASWGRGRSPGSPGTRTSPPGQPARQTAERGQNRVVIASSTKAQDQRACTPDLPLSAASNPAPVRTRFQWNPYLATQPGRAERSGAGHRQPMAVRRPPGRPLDRWRLPRWCAGRRRQNMNDRDCPNRHAARHHAGTA